MFFYGSREKSAKLVILSSLTKSTFVNDDNITKFVKLTNEKGTDVTDKYTVEISSTSANVLAVVDTGVTESETAYVQVTVKSGTDVVKQSDAIKVTLTDNVVSSLEGFAPVAFNVTIVDHRLRGGFLWNGRMFEAKQYDFDIVLVHLVATVPKEKQQLLHCWLLLYLEIKPRNEDRSIGLR